MFGWIEKSAVYEAGFIGNGEWDEDTSSYHHVLPEEVVAQAIEIIDKGFILYVHGTIEASDGTTEIMLRGSKVERQTTPDGDISYISFDDGSTLNGGTLTIPFGDEGSGGSGIKNIWDSTGTGSVAGGNPDSSAPSVATGEDSFAFGYNAKAEGNYSHAEGYKTQALGNYSHAEGDETVASGPFSHAEGFKTQASAPYTHAEGSGTKALAECAHVEGSGCEAITWSHAEGYNCKVYSTSAHAEGNTNSITGTNSYSAHVEGANNLITNNSPQSHIEGTNNKIENGGGSHVEGGDNESYAGYAHVEGYGCEAKIGALEAHAEGLGTIVHAIAQHAGGQFNIEDTTSLEIIGNGTDDNARSNARTLDKSGNEWLAGQIQPELGLRLKAPNGTYYNVTVDNTGALSITAVT